MIQICFPVFLMHIKHEIFNTSHKISTYKIRSRENINKK